MLAKVTSKNQFTLLKSVTQAVGATEYFDVEVRAGQVILTPVRIQRGDAVRAKLAELALSEADMAVAVAWARSQAASAVLAVLAAEPAAAYGSAPAKAASTTTTSTTTRCSASERSTFLTDHGVFNPRSCSYSAVSFMCLLIDLKNQILQDQEKNHSGIDEEPFCESERTRTRVPSCVNKYKR